MKCGHSSEGSRGERQLMDCFTVTVHVSRLTQCSEITTMSACACSCEEILHVPTCIHLVIVCVCVYIASLLAVGNDL